MWIQEDSKRDSSVLNQSRFNVKRDSMCIESNTKGKSFSVWMSAAVDFCAANVWGVWLLRK